MQGCARSKQPSSLIVGSLPCTSASARKAISVHITLRLCLGETARFKDSHLLEWCQIMTLGVSSSPGGLCCHSDVSLLPSQRVLPREPACQRSMSFLMSLGQAAVSKIAINGNAQVTRAAWFSGTQNVRATLEPRYQLISLPRKDPPESDLPDSKV